MGQILNTLLIYLQNYIFYICHQFMLKIPKIIQTKIFIDGADISVIKKYKNHKKIHGFTSNPSLMAKANVKNYADFIERIISLVKKKSLSFEVTKDDHIEIERQAFRIAKFAKNISIKVPIVNSKGKSNISVIKKLSDKKINLNVTAINTFDQCKKIIDVINPKNTIILSIFAGRIADTGRDPMKTIKKVVSYINKKKKNKFIKTLWASTREVYNIFQANEVKTDIITVPISILEKINLFNKNLNQYSAETSKMFYEDALKSKIDI